MNAAEAGAGVVVARSAPGNRELQAKLAAMGIRSTPVETIRFAEPAGRDGLDRAVERIGDYDWLAFTSPRGVAAFVERLDSLGVGVKPGRPRMAAVGSRTAEALRRRGFQVEFVPPEFLTSALGEGLPSGYGRKVLLMRADIGEESLVSTLTRRGFEVSSVVAYRTEVVPGLDSAREVSGARLVAFASPSEVRGFKARIPPRTFDELAVRASAVCIGPVTAEAAKAAGFRSVVSCEEHTIDALAEAVREMVGSD